jgi:hypothetical protein
MSKTRCVHCHREAFYTHITLYHGTRRILEAVPVCDAHSTYIDIDNRETMVLEGLYTYEQAQEYVSGKYQIDTRF